MGCHREWKPIVTPQLGGQLDALAGRERVIRRAQYPPPHFRSDLEDLALERTHRGGPHGQEADRTGVGPPGEDLCVFARLELGEDVRQRGQGQAITATDEDRLLSHQAAPAVAQTNIEVVRPDAAVESHPLGHQLCVGVHALANASDLVDE